MDASQAGEAKKWKGQCERPHRGLHAGRPFSGPFPAVATRLLPTGGPQGFSPPGGHVASPHQGPRAPTPLLPAGGPSRWHADFLGSHSARHLSPSLPSLPVFYSWTSLPLFLSCPWSLPQPSKRPKPPLKIPNSSFMNFFFFQ